MWCVGWLTIFEKVHQLDQVQELEHIFKNMSAKHRNRNLKGDRTLAQLMLNVADCSSYLHNRKQRELALAEQVRWQAEQSEHVPAEGV